MKLGCNYINIDYIEWGSWNLTTLNKGTFRQWNVWIIVERNTCRISPLDWFRSGQSQGQHYYDSLGVKAKRPFGINHCGDIDSRAREQHLWGKRENIIRVFLWKIVFNHV